MEIEFALLVIRLVRITPTARAMVAAIAVMMTHSMALAPLERFSSSRAAAARARRALSMASRGVI